MASACRPGVDVKWETQLYRMVRIGMEEEAVRFLKKTRKFSTAEAKMVVTKIGRDLGMTVKASLSQCEKEQVMLSEEYRNVKQAYAKIAKQHARLLAEFERWLSRKGLASRTIQRHCQGVEPYINTFLLYKDAATANQRARRIAKFLATGSFQRRCGPTGLRSGRMPPASNSSTASCGRMARAMPRPWNISSKRSRKRWTNGRPLMNSAAGQA